ncbi:MAG TPA: hypothetical protein VJJ52_05055 [Candidatus Nanoarchaeia archaeon]|nr:hypothetical protein [Candidatus Nanoarchaeia archaeon]
MKMIFEAEDAIVGIICGLLVLGLTGKYFTLKLPPFVYVVAFGILIFFILLDLVNEVKDLSTHFGLIVFSIIHNLIDLVISLTLISYFTKWNIPYITANLVPYLQNEPTLYWIGMFLVIGNVVWLFIFPFAT